MPQTRSDLFQRVDTTSIEKGHRDVRVRVEDNNLVKVSGVNLLCNRECRKEIVASRVNPVLASTWNIGQDEIPDSTTLLSDRIHEEHRGHELRQRGVTVDHRVVVNEVN